MSNYGIHPFWRNNYRGRGTFSMFKGLKDGYQFQSFYKIEKRNVGKLVGPKIQKQDTNYRRSVCPQQRILIPFIYTRQIT